jgi:transcriptional regulator with XRE-family HTH domain
MPDDGSDRAREVGRAQLERLGRVIRARTNVSNPYLSQIERGLHEPSVRVLRSIARALNISAETLLVQAGLIDGDDPAGPSGPPPTVVAAVEADPLLTADQKAALLAVYRSYIESNE